MRSHNFWKIDTEGDKTIGVPAICSGISRPEPKSHSSCVADGLTLAVIGRCALCSFDRGGRVKVYFTFESFEGQDEVILEASVFQRERVEVAMPFLIWHATKTSD